LDYAQNSNGQSWDRLLDHLSDIKAYCSLENRLMDGSTGKEIRIYGESCVGGVNLTAQMSTELMQQMPILQQQYTVILGCDTSK